MAIQPFVAKDLAVRIALGGLHFGNRVSSKEVLRLISIANERGWKFIDTSPLYGGGLSEQLIGRSLNKLGPHSIKVATKVGLKAIVNRSGQFGVEPSKLTKRQLCDSVDHSLRSLGKDYVDILTIHCFDSLLLHESMTALENLYISGKFLNLSCSNFNCVQLKKFLKICRDYSFPLSSAQVHFNILERRPESRFIGICQEYDLQIHANRVLARGFLTKSFVSGSDQFSRTISSLRVSKSITPAMQDFITILQMICCDFGCDIQTGAVLWILTRSDNIVPIIGFRNETQMLQLINGLDSMRNSQAIELVRELESKIVSQNWMTFRPRSYFEK